MSEDWWGHDEGRVKKGEWWGTSDEEYICDEGWVKRMSGKLNFLSLAQMNNYQNLFTVDYMNKVSQKLIILYNF